MATLDGFGFATRRSRSNHSNKVPQKVIATVQPNAFVAFIQPIDIINKKATVTSSPSFSSSQQQTTAAAKKSKKSTSNKKPPPSSNTIIRYFTAATSTNHTSTTTSAPNNNIDVEMEEASGNDNDGETEETATICVIRQKFSITNIWTEIEQEYMQFDDDEDDYFDQDYEKEDKQERNVQKLRVSDNHTMEICNSSNRGRCRRFSETEQEDEGTPTIIKLLAATTAKRQKKTVDHELSEVMNQFLNLKSKIHLPKQQVNLLNNMEAEEDDDEGENLARILRYKMTCKESSLFVFQITQEFLY